MQTVPTLFFICFLSHAKPSYFNSATKPRIPDLRSTPRIPIMRSTPPPYTGPVLYKHCHFARYPALNFSFLRRLRLFCAHNNMHRMLTASNAPSRLGEVLSAMTFLHGRPNFFKMTPSLLKACATLLVLMIVFSQPRFHRLEKRVHQPELSTQISAQSLLHFGSDTPMGQSVRSPFL